MIGCIENKPSIYRFGYINVLYYKYMESLFNSHIYSNVLYGFSQNHYTSILHGTAM